ncbi:MAG: hypothetical protein ACXW2T_09905, partial [Allosphingosinicella sp.]
MPNPLEGLTKLHSRLRCVANGKTDVNAIRAQQNGAVRVTSVSSVPVPNLRKVTLAQGLKSLGRDVRRAKLGAHQKRLSNDVEVSVFILFNRDSATTPNLVTRRSGRIGTATVPVSRLGELDRNSAVQSIELGESLKTPDPSVGARIPSAPSATRHKSLNVGHVQITPRKRVSLDRIGENVLVGIIDVGGIDFA